VIDFLKAEKESPLLKSKIKQVIYPKL